PGLPGLDLVLHSGKRNDHTGQLTDKSSAARQPATSPQARSTPWGDVSSRDAAGSSGSWPAIPSSTADASAPAWPLAAQCSSDAASVVVRCAASEVTDALSQFASHPPRAPPG